MPTETPAADFQRITLRIPPDLHRRLIDEAERNGRSLNAEVVARLEAMQAKGASSAGATPFIAGRPTEADLVWLCLHPGHSLAMVEIEGAFVPLIQDENGQGPVVPNGGHDAT